MILRLLPLWHTVNASCTPHAADSLLHGPAHWERVAENSIRLGQPEGDIWVALHFALIHDAFREDDWADPEHGRRAARWLKDHADLFEPRMYYPLRAALEGHADGRTTEHPTVGLCWDADRLDLPRVGVTPDPRLMSTAAGQRAAAALAR